MWHLRIFQFSLHKMHHLIELHAFSHKISVFHAEGEPCRTLPLRPGDQPGAGRNALNQTLKLDASSSGRSSLPRCGCAAGPADASHGNSLRSGVRGPQMLIPCSLSSDLWEKDHETVSGSGAGFAQEPGKRIVKAKLRTQARVLA